ncbi:hypothetical protein BHF68_00685 [Desulfuribacillus alkaliarsenatis]|uniref:histidine kinase n=1 Tax=Desulfuribacillus alkaliarsenatis TaxID=766136 RepID=A0A1E5G640_9FIRM|nr:hypothetical protein BHF68_00685 [Desulfuribacillus alkaliarsenatis]
MITPISFVFQSVPEAIVFAIFFVALMGMRVKDNLIKATLAGVLLASSTVVFWAVELPFLVRFFLQLPVFWIILYLIFRAPFNKVMITGTIAFGLLIIAETISLELALLIFGITHADVMQSDFLKITVVSGGYVVLLIISWVMNKKRWSLFKQQEQIEMYTTKDVRKINTYLMVLVLQVLLIVSINLSYVTGFFQFSNLAFHIVTFVLIIVTGFLLFFAHNIITISAKAGELEAHKEYLKNVNDLFVTIRGQRHDFLNHLQVIHSYAKMGKTEKVQAYANSLFAEVKEISKITIPNNATLSALLQTKNVLMESDGIELDINVKSSFQNTALKDIELVKLVGNLLDNAREAIIENDVVKEQRKIILKIFDDADYTHLVVNNLRPTLTEEQIQKMLVSGYTTKANHTGIGLSIVQQIVERYSGIMNVTSSETDGTVIAIAMPIVNKSTPELTNTEAPTIMR